jgi:hypothetical protein
MCRDQAVVARMLPTTTDATRHRSAGLAVCLLAAAFPSSEFHGYDISKQ